MNANEEHGKLYISKEFNTAAHLCACGCGKTTITPYGSAIDWNLIENNGLYTLSPSIGNFCGETPYHAHYYIRDNKIIWL